MIKNILLFCALIIGANSCFGQTDIIKDVTYHFIINNHKFIGQGADTLKAHIKKSQFFLIGEEHDMTELQRLTADIIPFLKNNGYKNFAVEIGPISAKKLTSIYHNKESLMDFNTKYYKYFDGGPFGFFDGKEEETFLNAAFDNGFNLWGIDFENYNAPLYIFDELFNLSNKSVRTKQLYNQAYQYVIDEYTKGKSVKNYPVCTHLLNSAIVNSYFDVLPNNAKVSELIFQLKSSWKIYEAEAMNNWFPRVANMKSNFVHEYKQETKKEVLPKIFMKMGAVHTARGTSFSGFQEVGNTIYELANYNGTKAFSVISVARYREDNKGVITDEIDPGDTLLLKYTTKDEWSIIDLKKLAIDGWQGKIKLSQSMKDYIQKYDMMLIPPVTKRMTPNIRQ